MEYPEWKKQVEEALRRNQVCNLVTRISPWERGKKVTLDRQTISRAHPAFSSRPVIRTGKILPAESLIRKEDAAAVSSGSGDRGKSLEKAGGAGGAENAVYFYEPIVGKERLILLGGGHISRCLCEFAAKTGFAPWVVDERPEFASRERFPLAKEVICGGFVKTLEALQIGENDYVAILTRGHSCDGDCLFYILTHELPGYLGMIGSKKRVAAQLALFRERGIPEEKLALVHNPIGLPIHAVTPEEIAVSILAELICEKRKEGAGERIQTELDCEVLSEWLLVKKPCASAVIVSASGSSPRKEGARMLILSDKSIRGTIGGGLLENKVIEKGCSLIGTGEAFLFHFEMDADVAAREGMACGGTVDVLIEDVRWSGKPVE